jgi:hypothetical protein
MGLKHIIRDVNNWLDTVFDFKGLGHGKRVYIAASLSPFAPLEGSLPSREEDSASP